MRSWMIVIAVLAWFGNTNHTTYADMADEIRAVLADKLLNRTQVGIEIVSLGKSAADSHVIYSQNATQLFMPASNLKVVTTSAALDSLGADFKFKTRLVQVDDSLAIVGDGDPTLGDVELLHKLGWGTTTTFQAWAAELKKRSVTTTTNILIDDSVFDEQFVHPTWPVDQIHKRYMAGVAGLNLNANCMDFYLQPRGAGLVVDFTVDPPTKLIKIANQCVQGRENAVWLSREPNSSEIILKGQTNEKNIKPISVTVQDPAVFAGQVFADVLMTNGVQIKGEVKRDRTIRARLDAGDKNVKVIALLETPLMTIIDRANKDSMNLYAEALCKRLGYETTKKPGTWDNGPAAVAAFLGRIGVATSEFSLVDGCGLSRQDQISPGALVKILSHDFQATSRDVFVASLAVGGVDGTLDDRFRDELKGRVHAKSGFIKGVSCLSGFVQTKAGSWFAFSIMMNGIPEGSNSAIKPIQEKLIRMVDKHVSGLHS